MKARSYYHRLSVASTALWIIFSGCKDCPDNGYAKSDHLDINVVFSSDKLTVKVLNSSNFRYTQNGILHMLDRNKRIKPRPERFQNCKDVFDLILTCEERVYDQVVEDLNSREQETCQPVHVINVDIQDNHEEATLGAFLICELCQCIQHTEDMENEIDELLQEFEEKSGRTFLHTVCFY
ncbi:RNA polymerase II subunit A C-terminal domain phosphatase SSU72 isoform 2-T2 [Alca torda]